MQKRKRLAHAVLLRPADHFSSNPHIEPDCLRVLLVHVHEICPHIFDGMAKQTPSVTLPMPEWVDEKHFKLALCHPCKTDHSLIAVAYGGQVDHMKELIAYKRFEKSNVRFGQKMMCLAHSRLPYLDQAWELFNAHRCDYFLWAHWKIRHKSQHLQQSALLHNDILFQHEKLLKMSAFGL